MMKILRVVTLGLLLLASSITTGSDLKKDALQKILPYPIYQHNLPAWTFRP